MPQEFHVYLIRLEAKIRIVYSAATLDDALAFEEEFNRRSLRRPTGAAAYVDVHKTCTTSCTNGPGSARPRGRATAKSSGAT